MKQSLSAKIARRALLLLVLALPTLAAVGWACYPATRAAIAVLTFDPVTIADSDWDDPRRLLDHRRLVQRHFLAHGVYIPMEDIVAADPNQAAPGSLALLMQKACGPGRLYVWIPMKFQLPVTGQKVIEWCWKPQTKNA